MRGSAAVVARAAPPRTVEVRGHGVTYRVLGSGPPVVLLKPHGGAPVYELAAWLAARRTVLQVGPLGFAGSERPSPPSAAPLEEQVHAVLDRQGVDRAPVWGYSIGGAMALAVARSSDRTTAVVCGGWSPAERLSAAQLDRADREARAPAAARAFWRWHAGIDWLGSLATMPVPRLAYCGTADSPRIRGPRGLPRTRDALVDRGVDVLDFDGLDHGGCMAEPALSRVVGPAVLAWLEGVSP